MLAIPSHALLRIARLATGHHLAPARRHVEVESWYELKRRNMEDDLHISCLVSSYQTRTRVVTVPGPNCPVLTENLQCNNEPCGTSTIPFSVPCPTHSHADDVNCVLSPFGPWSACNCDILEEIRTRTSPCAFFLSPPTLTPFRQCPSIPCWQRPSLRSSH